MKNFEATGRQLKREKEVQTNTLIVKRADQSNGALVNVTEKKTSPKTDEDRYVERYQNNEFWYSPWWTIQNWYEELGEKKLKNFCAQVHKLAGYGEVTVNVVLLMQRQLTFENKNYKIRRVDVVTYGIEEPLPESTKKRRYWYIMEGLRRECAFYLDLVDKDLMQFKFRKHVCGIKWK